MDIADIAPGELVEAQFNTLIEKRARQGDEEAKETLWQMSIRRYNERRRRQNRALWYSHFDRMAQIHAALAADYERRAEALLEPEGAA